VAPPTPSPDYRVGPGDVLEVEVFGNPDLSRNPTVQTNGMVALPLLGEVPVAGQTLAEVKSTITSRLGRDFLVNPQVDVRVKEYQSQFVTLLGEVSAPGRRPLRGGQTRLIDVLVEAGGLTPRASGELVVTRADGAFEDGTRTMRVQLGARTLTPDEERRLQLPLRAGDVISASPKYYVTVEGEVVRPGRYVLDSALTVSGAISSAGGLTRFGSQRVKVRRIDPATGRVEIVEVDLKAVRKGDKPDPPLQANDTVSVSRRIL
jgi:polysaccharide export outer membrane protein